MPVVHSYRKIPGDKCKGGKMPERKEIDLSKRCVSDLMGPQLLVSTSVACWLCTYLTCICCRTTLYSTCVSSFVKQIDNPSSKSVPIVVTVVIIMLLSIAGGILFVKKYVCGGRSDRFLFPCLSMLNVSVTVTWRQSECALQVFGSQVLSAAAACGGSRCWQHGRPAGDGPRSERQDWVSWRLRWGGYLLFPYTKAVIET